MVEQSTEIQRVTPQRLEWTKRIMEKLEVEIYYDFNMRIVLAESTSDHFLTTFEHFLDECKKGRRGE
jgi:hypothetical protein